MWIFVTFVYLIAVAVTIQTLSPGRAVTASGAKRRFEESLS